MSERPFSHSSCEQIGWSERDRSGVAHCLPDIRGRGHDALVTDLLTFVGLQKFSVQNSGVLSASLGAFVRKCVSNFTPASHRS